MSSQQSIFWYGVKAILVQYLGIFMSILSLFLLQYHYIFTIIGIIIGIGIFMKGKAMRFEYKMKSGYLVHGGDR